MIEQGDLLLKENPTRCSCQVWWRQTYLWLMILHINKIYWKDIKNELKSYHNMWNPALMQDSWLQLKSDSTSSRKTLNNAHRFSGLSWVHFAKRGKFYLNQKVGFEETPRLDPYWKLQPVAYKVNMEWKWELCLWTKTVLTRGSEFLMARKVGHKLQQWPRRQRVGNLRNAVRRLCVKIECKWFCKPIKGRSKTTKTYFCQLIQKNFSVAERIWTHVEPQDYSPIDYPV